MLHYIKSDLLEVKNGIIGHGVNCQGVMGSGVALGIKKKYPSVYEAYRRAVTNHPSKESLLGMVQLVKAKPDVTKDKVLVANIFTQNKYGKDGKRYLDYEALYVGLDKLHKRTQGYNLPLCIPKIGCGLAGGDWSIVSKMIEKAYPEDVYVYELSQKEKMINSGKTIIAGSRGITSYEVLEEVVNDSGFCIQEVVSGTAKGVDTLGEEYSIKHNIPLVKFPADWNKHGRAAGPIRNAQMADYADSLIALWDGKSRGTKNMIEDAQKKGLNVFVKVIEKGN